MKKLIIIGAGNLAKLTLDIIHEMNKIQNDIEVVGFVDGVKENVGKKILGYKHLGTEDYLYSIDINEYYFVCAIANTSVKRSFIELLDKLNAKYINLIHPTAIISDYSKIGTGIIVNAGAILAIDCEIKDHVFINFDCTIGHDVVIEKYCSLMPSVNVAGAVLLEEAVYLGMDSTVLENRTIGTLSVIGGNALVNKDIPNKVIAVGVPAKPIKTV